MDKDIGWDRVDWTDMDWTDLAQDRNKWRAVVSSVMNRRFTGA